MAPEVDAGADSRPTRPARLKDVAELAGVSLKTVTNVVHERRYVKDETRARVKAAIAELGYTPSLVGRQLQSGRSNIVALAVPRIDEPYLGALAHALIMAGERHGYAVFTDETGRSDDHELRAAGGYPGHSIDGVIYSPLAVDPQRVTELSRFTPMVLLGEHLSEGTADYVAIDNEQSARDVVRHLAESGRQRIAYVGGNPNRPSSVGQLRFQGFCAAVKELGLESRDEWLLRCDRYSREAGTAMAERLLPRIDEIDALVCASDLLAIGAIRTLIEHQVRVPDDVAVIGWDNIIDGRYLSPSLSSVATDLDLLADKTFEALISRIDGNRDPARIYTVPHQLVIRESSRPISPSR
ncbi:LacI family DNA-binding transcriptional regulator [Kribbella sp. NPDC051952]|uniref:LacI family DNA-binding transcriptional regulator n=1 Tax=Kribbella sp. NPDC051952 TaxID=3154851 RepID=UPI0034178E7B